VRSRREVVIICPDICNVLCCAVLYPRLLLLQPSATLLTRTTGAKVLTGQDRSVSVVRDSYGKSPFFMGKLLKFTSYASHYQRVEVLWYFNVFYYGLIGILI